MEGPVPPGPPRLAPAIRPLAKVGDVPAVGTALRGCYGSCILSIL